MAAMPNSSLPVLQSQSLDDAVLRQMVFAPYPKSVERIHLAISIREGMCDCEDVRQSVSRLKDAAMITPGQICDHANEYRNSLKFLPE